MTTTTSTYELTIVTSDRGTIRRHATTLAEAQKIRREWTRYSTTEAINVTGDGSEIESLTYDRDEK